MKGNMTVSELASYLSTLPEPGCTPAEHVKTILSLIDLNAWKPGSPDVDPLNAWVDYVLGAIARQA